MAIAAVVPVERAMKFMNVQRPIITAISCWTAGRCDDGYFTNTLPKMAPGAKYPVSASLLRLLYMK
jgi:hypothetical protein